MDNHPNSERPSSAVAAAVWVSVRRREWCGCSPGSPAFAQNGVVEVAPIPMVKAALAQPRAAMSHSTLEAVVAVQVPMARRSRHQAGADGGAGLASLITGSNLTYGLGAVAGDGQVGSGGSGAGNGGRN